MLNEGERETDLLTAAYFHRAMQTHTRRLMLMLAGMIVVWAMVLHFWR